MPLPSVAVHAPAKLNLALAVGPREPGGLHPICSWMLTIDLCDELRVRRLPAGGISRYAIRWNVQAPRAGEIDWSIGRDLAVRAHLALERRLGRPLPVQLRLEKRIPVGGGFGGGSSNAAAMLHAVNDLFDLGLPAEELADIGASLGADVPFLIRGGSATVEGFGERIEGHGVLPELHFVIVVPEARCPTDRVYRAFDEAPARPLRRRAVRALVAEALRDPPAPLSPAAFFNDLTAAALSVVPELEPLLGRVASLAGRPALLSGSGSGIFVLCDHRRHAEQLSAALAEACALPALAVTTVAGPRRMGKA